MTSPCSSVVGTLSPATRCDTTTASAHSLLRFQAALADETTLETRTVLVTTGLGDQVPDIPGIRERWGRDVLHCPYCHRNECPYGRCVR